MTNQRGDNIMRKANLDKVLAALDTATEEDLKVLNRAIRERYDALASDAVASFHVKQAVEFTARGRTHRGTITSINRKTVTVRVKDAIRGLVNWRVSAGLLKASK
jgi:hypothetical protein